MTVKFFAYYRDATKVKEISVPATGTVWDLALVLIERFGKPIKDLLLNEEGNDFGKMAIILVNGMNIVHTGGKDTRLKEEDTVAVFPPVAGG